MDIVTKRTVLDKVPEQLSDLVKEYKLEQVEYVEKGAVIPERELEIDEEERTVVKYVSTISVDRDGDIIRPDGILMDDFRKNPVILYAHNHGSIGWLGGGDPVLPLGKDIWIKPDKFGVKAKQKYAKHQLAEDVFQMHKDGFALASSIGFIPLEYVRNDGSKEWKEAAKDVRDKYGLKKKDVDSANIIFTKTYLLEHSDVPVPSNPDALALAYESGDFKCKSVELVKDLALEPTEEEKLAKSLELETEKVKNLALELSGSQIANSELQKQVSELEHTISKKDAEIKRIKAEKPKFTKEMAEKIINTKFKEITDHIRKKFGEV